MPKFFIGTSGWNYPHWQDVFYPKDLSQRKWLEYYINLWPCTKEVTADFIYLRFHGRDGLYSGNYSDRKLKEWARFAKDTNKDMFAFFNNDAYGYAVKNALKFRELLEK